MTQEEKQLLFKDLSARLPYGVKVFDDMGRTYTLNVGNAYFIDLLYSNGDYVEPPFKPYLRPMSSMTEEEKKDLLDTVVGKDGVKYFQVLPDGSIDNNDSAHQDLSNFNIHWVNFDGVNTSAYIDWLNAHHFDYRGLIPKNLAIAVNESNNPYKD